MINPFRRPLTAFAITFLVAVAAQLPPAAADGVNDGANDGSGDAVITRLLESQPEDVRLYNDHLTTLANPAMEGRLPGTRGMERAMQYVEYWFEAYGLEPAFPSEEVTATGTTIQKPRSSWRQRFPLGGSVSFESPVMTVTGPGGELSMIPARDFEAMALGGGGDVSGSPVFIGYSIDNGPDGWSSFAADDDLTGRIAVMLRFEPMDEDGRSLWAATSEWSGRAGFAGKIRAARARNAEAIIIINPPDCRDPRSADLETFASSGGGGTGSPVFGLSREAGQKLIAACDVDGRSLLDLRRHADRGGGAIELGGTIAMSVTAVREDLHGENVAGLLPGRGALAGEIIVVGAHLDHLGMGEFGSRTGPGRLHPGADDNASGSAGVLLLAQKLADSYAALPPDADARTILLMCFSAEESGLNGSRYYVENPIAPIADHALMVNFDMIGRIVGKRLSVSGTSSGEGMAEWLQPYFDASPLEIIAPARMSGASDHTPFHRKGMPILFAIIADFHADYHTPEDVSWKINRVAATEAVRLFHEILLGAAARPERFTFTTSGGTLVDAGPQRSNIRVRFGIAPGDYAEGETGVLVGDVFENTSASNAGILPGDRLVRWNKEEIGDVGDWMGKLGAHEPGDEVEVGLLRDGREVTVFVTLLPRRTDG